MSRVEAPAAGHAQRFDKLAMEEVESGVEISFDVRQSLHAPSIPAGPIGEEALNLRAVFYTSSPGSSNTG